MNLQNLIEKAIEALTGRDEEERRRPDVRPATEDPYGDPADQGEPAASGVPGDVIPASQDPYGDPADQYEGHPVLDASQDPYGDPADQYQGHPVLDASQDPYGDPADQKAAAPRGRARR